MGHSTILEVGGASRSAQDGSKRLLKSIFFAPEIRYIFGAQDGLQNGPRSAQDGPKRLLKSNFFAFENRLNFRLVLGWFLVDFSSPLGAFQV